MSNTPERIKKHWRETPATRCDRQDKDCSGRLTKEHAILYSGRQVQELWAILDLCWYHHLGEGLKKSENIKIAMARATEADRKKYPRLLWKRPVASNFAPRSHATPKDKELVGKENKDELSEL